MSPIERAPNFLFADVEATQEFELREMEELNEAIAERNRARAGRQNKKEKASGNQAKGNR